MSRIEISKASSRVVTVQPGFNAVGFEEPVQALEAKPDYEIFDKDFVEVMRGADDFVLVLGRGFETANAAAGLGSAPCGGLAGIPQLRYLQKHGLTTIVMASQHGTLAQNARSIGIEVIAAGC
jgi:hypothetical protein